MIDRYECFTGFQATNYDAERRNDGPWVSYDDHAEAMQKLWHTAYTRENVNIEALATLRAEVERLKSEISDHMYVGRTVVERAEKAERERDEARALSLAGDDMESEGDRVAFLKKCETIIELEITNETRGGRNNE